MTDQYYDFMEGVNFEDYCFNCGTPLERVDTMPDGQKIKIIHHPVMKIGNQYYKDCGESRQVISK